MRRKLLFAAVGLVLLVGPARSAAPPDKAGGTCGKHGTAVEFVSSPAEAARLAKQDEKLVFVLHLSGIFEDPNLT
jgi:hypothetical protein